MPFADRSATLMSWAQRSRSGSLFSADRNPLARRPVQVQQESVEVSIDPRTRCRLSLDRHPVECGKSRVNASDQRQVTGLDRATAQYLVQCLVRLAFLYSHREALHEKLVSGNAP